MKYGKVDFDKVYKVIIDDKLWGYKPTGETVRRFKFHRPESQIIGFGYYGFLGYWYFLVYSPFFPPYELELIKSIHWRHACGLKMVPALPPGGGGNDSGGGPRAS